MDIKVVGRWWASGLCFYAATQGALYGLIGLLHAPLLPTTLAVSEGLAIVRFMLNDRWVFRQPGGFTWQRFWQYHVANAVSMMIWWSVTNLLPLAGVHYLVASTIGTGCSVGCTMLIHFWWVWRPVPPGPAANEAVAGSALRSQPPPTESC